MGTCLFLKKQKISFVVGLLLASSTFAQQAAVPDTAAAKTNHCCQRCYNSYT
jgi:hypothetical protein